MKDTTKNVIDRTSAIRIRTWSLTLTTIIAIVFYVLISFAFKDKMNVADFVFLFVMQIIIHSTYFPDGELYGQRDTSFKANKQAYNEKAEAINREKKIKRLREFCQWDFEQRKKTYVINECSGLGLTIEELEQFKSVGNKGLKKLKSYELKDEKGNTRLFFLTRRKRKRIYALLYKELPIEINHPETIMSAIENNGNHSIKDNSIGFKAFTHIQKAVLALGIGLYFAYIGYTAKDGIGFAEIGKMVMYLGSLFGTAVISYSKGETCSKVHKNRFYIDLINYIDSFNEWDGLNGYKEGD